MAYKRNGLLKVMMLVVMVATVAQAAPWDNSRRLKKMAEAYDTASIDTIAGTVEEVYDITPSHSPNYGYHMILKTEKEKVNVHLGPGWYLKNISGLVAVGDSVQVTGAWTKEPMTHNNVKLRALRAAEVKKGGTVVMTLRDKNGKPAWSGY